VRARSVEPVIVSRRDMMRRRSTVTDIVPGRTSDPTQELDTIASPAATTMTPARHVIAR